MEQKQTEISNQEHRRIIDAIKARDSRLAVENTQKHIETVKNADI